MKSIEFIEERENSFRVHIPYFDEKGIRRFYSKSFSIKKYGTKQRALEFAKNHRDEIKVKLANNLVVKEKHYSLDKVFEETMKIYNATLETKRKINCLYGKYIQSFIGGNRDFSTIRYDDIQKCLNSMVSVAKNDTIERVKFIWCRLYRYAVAMDIVMKDETYSIILPKSDLIEHKKTMDFEMEDFMDLIEKINYSVKSKRESMLIQGALWIMLYTGMRPNEVLALQKEDIDFDYFTINIYKAVGTTTTETNTIKKTKNSSSIRTIPIRDEIVNVLNQLIQISNTQYIFTKDNGELMNGTYLSNLCYRLVKGKVRPYMLRHKFSTDLLLSGTDLRTIQELMGHTEASMTLGYARSNDKAKEKAIENRIKLLN